jgi:hypothetical protein
LFNDLRAISEILSFIPQSLCTLLENLFPIKEIERKIGGNDQVVLKLNPLFKHIRPKSIAVPF